MTFQIKRIYEPAQPSDGIRVLIDRLWPRGVKKSTAHLDHWMKDVAPSPRLRLWFGHRPERFVEFGQRYKKELNGNPRSCAAQARQRRFGHPALWRTRPASEPRPRPAGRPAQRWKHKACEEDRVGRQSLPLHMEVAAQAVKAKRAATHVLAGQSLYPSRATLCLAVAGNPRKHCTDQYPIATWPAGCFRPQFQDLSPADSTWLPPVNDLGFFWFSLPGSAERLPCRGTVLRKSWCRAAAASRPGAFRIWKFAPFPGRNAVCKSMQCRFAAIGGSPLGLHGRCEFSSGATVAL